MRARDILPEKWSEKYKRSINCFSPKGFSQRAHCQGRKKDEDQHPNEKPQGPETKPTMPSGTVRVDVSDVYDWYKLGQHVSNMKGLGKHDFGKGPPSTIFSFGSEDEEHEYLKDLEKIGLDTTDIDPKDPKQPKGMKKQKTDPTYNVNESKEINITSDELITHFRNFLKICMLELDLDTLPQIEWISGGKLHKERHSFGSFKNDDQVIRVEITNRHPVDIMRTLAHELVHYRQWLEGRMKPGSGKTGSDIENEAHAVTGVIMRRFNNHYPDVFELKPVTEEQNKQYEKNIKEKINPEITQSKFYAEKTIDIKDIGKITLTAKNISTKRPPQFVVTVTTSEGKDIGYFRFVVIDYEPEKKNMFGFKVKSKLDPYVLGGNVSVWNQYQKKGIATEVYRFVKELGNDIKPSSTQTDAGKAMWRSFNKQEVGENFADGKGPGRPGDSARHGIPKGATIAQLEKAAKAKGRKGQLARWQLNMRRGKKK